MPGRRALLASLAALLAAPAGAQQAVPATEQKDLPAWQRLAVRAPDPLGRPTIAILLDDMGLNRPQSTRATMLPGPLTLSWMSYAPNVTEQAQAAAARGHETMLHMPMEPLGRTDPGPDALRTWQTPADNLARLRAALDRLPLAIGLNQHEGSIASLSVPLMDLVMGELKSRGLVFIDSLTIQNSVALARARAMEVPSIPRDVFLDNTPDHAAIRAQLAQTETIARRTGHALAIGHPRTATVDVLEKYLPTVEARGFVLWPVSATLSAQLSRQLVAAPPPR